MWYDIVHIIIRVSVSAKSQMCIQVPEWFLTTFSPTANAITTNVITVITAVVESNYVDILSSESGSSPPKLQCVDIEICKLPNIGRNNCVNPEWFLTTSFSYCYSYNHTIVVAVQNIYTKNTGTDMCL